jgi:hypothetical protein
MDLLKQQHQQEQPTVRLLSSAKRRNALHNVHEGLSLTEFQFRLVDKEAVKKNETNISSCIRTTKVGRASVY